MDVLTILVILLSDAESDFRVSFLTLSSKESSVLIRMMPAVSQNRVKYE